jgi:hypothetical protein
VILRTRSYLKDTPVRPSDTSLKRMEALSPLVRVGTPTSFGAPLCSPIHSVETLDANSAVRLDGFDQCYRSSAFLSIAPSKNYVAAGARQSECGSNPRPPVPVTIATRPVSEGMQNSDLKLTPVRD